jgi:hypothetical protein
MTHLYDIGGPLVLTPDRVTFHTEPRMKTFGGWYQITRVHYDGKELDGYIQTKRRHKRTQTTTVYGSYCVRGHDWPWLLRQQDQPQT